MNRHNDKLTTMTVGQHRLEKKVIWALGFAWAQVHPPPPKIPNHSSTFTKPNPKPENTSRTAFISGHTPNMDPIRVDTVISDKIKLNHSHSLTDTLGFISFFFFFFFSCSLKNPSPQNPQITDASKRRRSVHFVVSENPSQSSKTLAFQFPFRLPTREDPKLARSARRLGQDWLRVQAIRFLSFLEPPRRVDSLRASVSGSALGVVDRAIVSPLLGVALFNSVRRVGSVRGQAV